MSLANFSGTIIMFELSFSFLNHHTRTYECDLKGICCFFLSDKITMNLFFISVMEQRFPKILYSRYIILRTNLILKFMFTFTLMMLTRNGSEVKLTVQSIKEVRRKSSHKH